jgi:hypothetical protein
VTARAGARRPGANDGDGKDTGAKDGGGKENPAIAAPPVSTKDNRAAFGATENPKMSRAMNLALPEDKVVAQCDSKAIRISATEPLLSGGTHLVCITIEGADEARRLFKDSIIDGAVRRVAFHRADASQYR